MTMQTIVAVTDSYSKSLLFKISSYYRKSSLIKADWLKKGKKVASDIGKIPKTELLLEL